MQVNNTVGSAMEMANNFVTRQNYAIGHVWFISIQAWIQAFGSKLQISQVSFVPQIPKRDLDTKKTTPNIDDLNERSHCWTFDF